MTQIGAIGAFAALATLGTLIRWQASSWAPAVGTAAVNLAGAFAAGLLYNYSGPFVTAVLVGAVGALTTVSGLAAQVARLAQTSRNGAVLYLAALVPSGTLAAWLGLRLAGG